MKYQGQPIESGVLLEMQDGSLFVANGPLDLAGTMPRRVLFKGHRASLGLVESAEFRCGVLFPQHDLEEARERTYAAEEAIEVLQRRCRWLLWRTRELEAARDEAIGAADTATGGTE